MKLKDKALHSVLITSPTICRVRGVFSQSWVSTTKNAIFNNVKSGFVYFNNVVFCTKPK